MVLAWGGKNILLKRVCASCRVTAECVRQLARLTCVATRRRGAEEARHALSRLPGRLDCPLSRALAQQRVRPPWHPQGWAPRAAPLTGKVV